MKRNFGFNVNPHVKKASDVLNSFSIPAAYFAMFLRTLGESLMSFGKR